MIKNKLDYKLINITLMILSIFLIYQTKDLWVSGANLLYKIFMPFLIAFALAYALYPLVQKLNKKLPKSISIMIVTGSLVAIVIMIVLLLFPLLFDQMKSLFSGIVTFLKEISIKHNINFKDVQDTLSSNFNSIVEKVGAYISDGAISVISISLDYISKIFIIFTALVYLLIDMDKIRKFVKNYFINKSAKTYNYVKTLDNEMRNYLSGFIKIVMISFFEYSILYTIIGHPNALMLGSLAALGNLIPYFGGIITNVIAAVTAFVISPELFIRTCIVFIVCSGIDGNIINPLVYGKTNKVHPIVIILSVFAGGILFGIMGIIISLPVSILIIATIKYFKDDIVKMKKKLN